jgi:hypothetical protein
MEVSGQLHAPPNLSSVKYTRTQGIGHIVGRYVGFRRRENLLSLTGLEYGTVPLVTTPYKLLFHL